MIEELDELLRHIEILEQANEGLLARSRQLQDSNQRLRDTVEELQQGTGGKSD